LLHKAGKLKGKADLLSWWAGHDEGTLDKQEVTALLEELFVKGSWRTN
jgi:hypothetical protein